MSAQSLLHLKIGHYPIPGGWADVRKVWEIHAAAGAGSRFYPIGSNARWMFIGNHCRIGIERQEEQSVGGACEA